MMLEGTMIFNVFVGCMSILLTIIGFFIMRFLKRQDENWVTMDAKIDAILVQVNATNGRVGRLEEWKINHEKTVDGIHQTLREWIKEVAEQVRDVLRRERRG